MPWPDFRHDQTDLDRLCAPRVVCFSEYHDYNETYGFDRILRAYAGLPEGEPFPWAMEHSINFDNPEPLTEDVEARLPFLLAVNEGQAQILRKRTAAEVIPIGSAFYYLRAVLRETATPQRRGTLVFPHKSPRSYGEPFDADRWAEQLAALPAEYQPVAVSVFWRDHARGAHRPYEKAGLMLVTSGNSFDPLFLYRQDELCRHFAYACANDVSASFCMAVLSGCHFFFWPNRAEPDLPGKRECARASPFPPGDGAEQRRLAERYAGKESVRPPSFFRDLFRRGQKAIAASVPAAIEFRPTQRLDRLAGWGPRGLDSDGWARPDFSLLLPAAADMAGVALTIEIPQPARPAGPLPFWPMELNGRPLGFPPTPGCHRLELPCPGAGSTPGRVAIRGADGESIDGRPGGRTFRLAAIEWCQRLTGPPLAWAFEPVGGLWNPCVPPGGFDLSSGAPPEVLSPWQADGIDEDGWAAASCGLVIPAHAGASAVLLYLDVPARPAPDWRAQWTVSIDGQATLKEVSAGTCVLRVPCMGKDPQPAAVLV